MTTINKKTVLLIVEDEVVLINTLEKRLSSEGFEILRAMDGDEGLKLALSKHPDLILLDILLPKVDGLTMFKKLREDSWGAHTPVVILTNDNSSCNIAEAMKINKNCLFEYILKANISLDDIVIRIKKRLNINN